VAQPSAQSVAAANDNNNAQAATRPGAFANPTPGTIVVHINGRAHAGFSSIWTSAGERFATAPAGSPGGPPIVASVTTPTATIPATPTATILGTNGTGQIKLAPESLYSYARIYLGADAMATNGLRYGAAIELRQNFTGQISDNTSTGASVNSSLETLFVRRAFTYVAGDQWGIVRAGQADGIIGLFDNGVTTFQYLPTSNLQNGDEFASLTPAGASVPFFFLSGSGTEYANTKLVYLSPRIAGVDFGIQYAPNTSNGYGISGSNNPLNGSIIGPGIGTGLDCTTANSGCPTLSSGPGIQDGSRILNQTAIGVRYQGAFGGIGALAYAIYEFSGHANYTGATTPAVLGNTVAGSRFNGRYDPLSFGNGGLALTYGGITIGGNIIGGRLNGQGGLAPQHGVGEIAYMVGAKYAIGPLTVGVAGERGDYQGNVNLTGISQRRGQAIDVGASYAVAPGYIVYTEYQYQTVYQGGFNFITNSIGSNANNTIRSQGFLVGNVVNF
jgi:predicted porin